MKGVTKMSKKASDMEGGMREELLEAWRTNNRITLYLVDRTSEAGMACTLSTHGGRDVARQFTHLHNVRVWHLENRAKDLARGMVKFQTKERPEKARLKDALIASGRALEQFLAGVYAGEKGRRGFRKGIFTTLAYFVAHESHHRGSILLTLKQCGCAPDQESRYAIWDWDRM